MSLWDDGGTGCVASKTDRLSPSEDGSLEMDITKRREHPDQPNISAEESQFQAQEHWEGTVLWLGGLESVTRGPAGAAVFPHHGCRLMKPKDEC